MKIVFADTGYWIALINPKDSLHQKALSILSSFGEYRIITSDLVCTELLNCFADKGVEF